MDNKIFKRIVAAAAGVTMLGTCAFATGLTAASYEEGTLSFDYTVADGATKVTYLAYAATVAGDGDETFTTVDGTNYVLGNIVAVNQLDEIPETKSEAVAISADLLGEATNIVLMSGDDLGSDVAYAAVATAPAAAGVKVSYYKVLVDAAATTVSESAYLENENVTSITLPEDPTESGYGFVGWYTDAALTTKYVESATLESDVKLYAKMAKIYKYGDINLDRRATVNGADAQAILDYVAAGNSSELYPWVDQVLAGTTRKVGDINQDRRNTVNGADAQAILDYVAAGNSSELYPWIGTQMEIVKD